MVFPRSASNITGVAFKMRNPVFFTGENLRNFFCQNYLLETFRSTRRQEELNLDKQGNERRLVA
jgi:hypothetical protein